MAAAAVSSAAPMDSGLQHRDDGIGWRSHLYAQLHVRDRLQRDNYTDIIDAYSTLLERYDGLRSRSREQESDLQQLRSSHPLSVSVNASSASSPSNSVATAAAELAQLRDLYTRKQEELTNVYRLRAEDSQTSLRLKETAERDEKLLIAKEEELARTKLALEALRRESQTLREERERKEKVMLESLELVRKELETVTLALQNSERDRQRLTHENDDLRSRLLRVKDEQIRTMNEMNESSGRRRPKDGKADKPEAERRQREEEEEKRRGELLSVDVDMTSSNAIIDHLAWQQNFSVVLPRERRRTVYAHRGQCMSLAYSPSGQLIVCGGLDGFVKVLEARSGLVKAQLRGSTDAIMHCSVNADDSLMLAAGNDQTARIWALRPQSASIAQQVQHKVSDISTTLDKTLHTLTDILPFGKPASPAPPSVSAAPPAAATTASGPAPPPFSTAGFVPKVIHTLNGHTAKIYAGCLDTDSSRSSPRAFTGSYDRTIRVWDLHSGRELQKIMCGSSCNHLSLSSGRGIELIASAHLDGHVRLWDAHQAVAVRDLDALHHQQVTSVEFSRDALLLLTTSRDNTLAVVDTRTWQPLQRLEGPLKDPFRNLVNWSRAVFSPDAQYALAGGHLGSLYVWQVDSGKCVTTLNANPQYDGSAQSLGRDAAESSGQQTPPTAISSVDWNRNGRQVVACDMQGNLFFWE